MRKMIVMDVDGTLLRSDGTCSEETKEYLNKLKNDGHIIVLATGRCFEEIMEPTDNAFFANYIISHTGSVIYNVSEKKFIFESKISKDMVEEIIDSYDEKIMTWISLVTLNKYNRFPLEYYEESKFTHTILDVKELNNIGNDVFNICIRLKQNNYANIVMDEMKEKFKELDFIIMQDSFGSEKRIEVVPKGINKSFSINKVAKLEHLDKKDIICFGDGLNDIAMLANCGLSVAMGNALDEVKVVCNDRCDTNDEDGVIKYLERYFEYNRVIK